MVSESEKGDRLSATAFRGYIRLADRWRLSTDERIDLLGASVSPEGHLRESLGERRADRRTSMRFGVGNKERYIWGEHSRAMLATT